MFVATISVIDRQLLLSIDLLSNNLTATNGGHNHGKLHIKHTQLRKWHTHTHVHTYFHFDQSPHKYGISNAF